MSIPDVSHLCGFGQSRQESRERSPYKLNSVTQATAGEGEREKGRREATLALPRCPLSCLVGRRERGEGRAGDAPARMTRNPELNCRQPGRVLGRASKKGAFYGNNRHKAWTSISVLHYHTKIIDDLDLRHIYSNRIAILGNPTGYHRHRPFLISPWRNRLHLLASNRYKVV